MLAPKKVMKKLSEIREDHRVKFAACDHPAEEFDEEGEVDEGCYIAYLMPGWSYNDGKELHHMVWSYSMPEMWNRMKTVEPCLCDECFKMPENTNRV